MLFNVNTYSWRDRCVTFTFQTKCMCHLLTVHACIHIQERHWLPLALSLGLRVPLNTELTPHKASEASPLTELATPCPRRHTVCELAFKILHVAFLVSSWPWVWTVALHAVSFCSLWNDNAPRARLSIIGCLYYSLSDNVTRSTVSNLWHPFWFHMIEWFPHILNSQMKRWEKKREKKEDSPRTDFSSLTT